jgi:hypothetical protein
MNKHEILLNFFIVLKITSWNCFLLFFLILACTKVTVEETCSFHYTLFLILVLCFYFMGILVHVTGHLCNPREPIKRTGRQYMSICYFNPFYVISKYCYIARNIAKFHFTFWFFLDQAECLTLLLLIPLNYFFCFAYEGNLTDNSFHFYRFSFTTS